MSCFGINYSPSIPRVWSRFQPVCDTTTTQMNLKASILQYRNNSSRLTKKQQYSQLVQSNTTKKWATQSDSYTNSNLGMPTSCANTIICVPTSNSDVPGKKMMLCSTRMNTQFYEDKIRRTMGNTNNNFPNGYKF